jgi:molybdopterin molybdotransferase
MAFGQIGDCLFVGLPGNPVASFVCFTLFARPMLAMLGGGRWHEALRFPVMLADSIKKRPGRTEMVRARLERQADRLLAHKIGKQGSGVLTSLVEADGLLELGHDLSDPVAGTIVPFMPFDGN